MVEAIREAKVVSSQSIVSLETRSINTVIPMWRPGNGLKFKGIYQDVMSSIIELYVMALDLSLNFPGGSRT